MIFIKIVRFKFYLKDFYNPCDSFLIKTTTTKAWEFGVLRLSDMLPDLTTANLKGYFRYIGSLTTPPCTEGVMWNVFRATVGISALQVILYASNILLI